MVFNLFLLVVFIASAIVVWYRVSVKIPELAAVPEDVLAEQFYRDSAKVRFFIRRARDFYQEKQYQEIILRFSSRTLYKTHIILLRLDNGIVRLLKKIREKKEAI